VSFLLDADTCSFHLRRSSALTTRFVQYSGRLSISTVAVAELYTWARRLDNPSGRLAKLHKLLDDVRVLDFDLLCADEFGRLQASQLKRGIVIPTPDLMIATVALVHDLTLVTHNTKDFQRIPGLRLEDWLSS
jgi:tRNA(fMet)-specific endonuclease VapC